MFVGRRAELSLLEQSFAREGFAMVVLYGRRRIGKTFLLTHFAKGKRALFFTAQEQSDVDNLTDFCRRMAEFFNLPQGMRFNDWLEAFKYCADAGKNEKFLFVFDEFPYAAQANGSLPSKLQIAIDHYFKKSNVCLVLCGSNQGFMESKVLGSKSPLYGRRTSQIKLAPFDYLDAAKMLKGTSPQDAFKYYACIGGTPYYLSQVDTAKSFNKNIETLFFSPQGYLFGESTMLLRQELREPAMYNSILRALAAGATKQKEIADKVSVESGKIARYLNVLRELEIIERIVPFGQNPLTSRKGAYRICDASFDFWYKFVAPAVADIEGGLGAAAAKRAQGDHLSEYLGRRFERVCMEWLRNQIIAGRLEIDALTLGMWWGADPVTRTQTDIDLLAADPDTHELLLGECKYRNNIKMSSELEKLFAKSDLIKGYVTRGYLFFTKTSPSAAQREKYQKQNVQFVSLQDMYEH